MKMKAVAQLKWLKLAPDGSAPRPGKFSVPAKFDLQGEDWRSNSWSLVVEHNQSADAGALQKVEVRFLMDSAPVEWLTRGRKFTLYDGAEPLAEGEVL
jgi:hypothetical protein